MVLTFDQRLHCPSTRGQWFTKISHFGRVRRTWMLACRRGGIAPSRNLFDVRPRYVALMSSHQQYGVCGGRCAHLFVVKRRDGWRGVLV